MDRTRRGSTSWWSWNTPTYSLSPARTASTARVASARATGRTPVTRGSRVPEWPAFGTENMSRTQALTWWDVGPAGLSTMATPRRIRSWIVRSSGRVPCFESGVSWRTTRSLIPAPGRRSRGPFRRRDRRPPAPSRVPLPSPGTSSPRTRGCSDASRPTVPRPWSCRCRGALRSPGSSGFPSCGVGRPGPERNSHLLEAASESDVLQYAGDDLAERNRKEGIQEDPRGQDVDRIQVHVIGPRHGDALVPEVIKDDADEEPQPREDHDDQVQ